jgi:hypothetical protein
MPVPVAYRHEKNKDYTKPWSLLSLQLFEIMTVIQIFVR